MFQCVLIIAVIIVTMDFRADNNDEYQDVDHHRGKFVGVNTFP